MEFTFFLTHVTHPETVLSSRSNAGHFSLIFDYLYYFHSQRHPSRYYQIEKEGRKRETDAETILQNGGDSQVRTRKKRRSFSYLTLWCKLI